jgi:hypothetical protein
MFISNGLALVLNTSNVCGNTLLSTRNVFLPFCCAMIIASAAAVPSSNKDAFVIGSPVSSVINV